MLPVVIAIVVFGSGVVCGAEKSKADIIGDAIADLSGSLSERREAVRTLASQSKEDTLLYEIVPLLQGILEDAGENPRVQVAAVQGLSEVADRVGGATKTEVMKMLTEIIKNNDAHALVRAGAVVKIGNMVDPKNYEGSKIKTLLKEIAGNKASPSSLTQACDDVLASIFGEDISGKLVESIRSGDLASVDLLVRLIVKKQGAVKLSSSDASALLDLAESERTPVNLRTGTLRLVAVAIKFGSRASNAGTSFEKIIKRSSNADVQIAAVKAIGITLDADLIRILVSVYDDNKSSKEAGVIRLRAAACASAGEFFGPLAERKDFTRYRPNLNKLSEMLVGAILNDQESSVAREAAFSLGNMYSKKYDRRDPAAALIETLDDKDASVADAALDSLKFITGEDFGKDQDAWRDWFKKNQAFLMPSVR